jgi:hypothetical protein
MKEDDTKKLRQYYHSIRGFLPVLQEARQMIDHFPVESISEEINQLLEDFPDVVPALNLKQFHSRTARNGDKLYDVAGLRTYLSRVLGRLDIEIEGKADTPVTERREFGFVADGDLRKIVERDYSEAQRAFVANCWKSVIILSGGMIEAMLSDVLISKEAQALNSPKAPKNRKITQWNLEDLINVSVDLRLVSTGVEKLSHPIREYRNLVHPGNEIRNKLQFDSEEAKISIEVIHIVHRSLSP